MKRSDWTVEDVAGLLKDGGGGLHPCCLLIGAGVSLTAGIPLGGGFVAKIKELHPQAYARAKRISGDAEPDYGTCMEEIGEGNRADLVRGFVEDAKTNWAHIGIGRLERAGHVDRVLTTNFDPLASRACALFNRFPAVYDLAALRNDDGEGRNARFIPAFVKGSAIYHLHGQHTGFLLLNTQKLLEEQADRVEQALREAVNGRVVIVCGYSGENDPLVERIARIGAFPHKLIWVRHDDADPCGTVCDTLIHRFQDCHVVRGISADRFFTELANELGLPQPEFLIDPFKHMLGVLEEVQPYKSLDERGVDLLEQGREMLRAAARTQEKRAPDQSEIARLMGEKRYAEVWAQFGADAKERSESERDMIAWAAIGEGNALSDQARQQEGAEAHRLFSKAYNKYAAALAIKPNKHQALNNWGSVLLEQARAVKGVEANALLAQAVEKLTAALVIKPDMYDALTNWGLALYEQAILNQGEEAMPLIVEAEGKYAAAFAIKQDDPAVLNNWGLALFYRAKQEQGAGADALFMQAGEKYAAALAIKPEMHEVLINWGLALSNQARGKLGEDAALLFAQAGEKFAAALALRPDRLDALNNWSNALLHEARPKQTEQAKPLIDRAEELLQRAEAIKEGGGSYNLACIEAQRGNLAGVVKWLRVGKNKQPEFPDCAHIVADPDFDRIRDDPEFRKVLAEIGC